MNERIRELAEQSGMTDDKFGMFFAVDNHNEDGVDLQKFAELIVRECLVKIESKRSSGENTDSWTITRDMCYYQMMQEIKEHFGIEE
jgi:hypothetical protein